MAELVQHPLVSYLPMDRLQALSQGAVLPDRMQGAVLFADVSGFTPLTTALAQELGAKRGAEELTLYLNQVYGALIEKVHYYRGSVICFAGDAITCWFEDDGGARATACALAMQKVVSEFTGATGKETTAFSFGIKILVLAGSARRFVVGNPQIQVMDVLAGALLDRIALAEHLVHRGEVLIGEEVLKALGDQAVIKGWRVVPQGESLALITDLNAVDAIVPWPVLPSISPELTYPWLFPAVSQRLVREEVISLAELRNAIPCFLQFSGIDYDQDLDAGARLDAFTRWVQSILSHYEGYLVQLTMGDKGNCMYILFGAPLSHEDDARRVMGAALALLRPPATLNFIRNIRIGISQGQMYIGTYGGPTRRTYGGIGREVNLAARLMEQARSGQILVSDRIAKAVPDYAFESLGALPFKGISQPVPVFAISESGSLHTTTARFVHLRSQLPLVGRPREQALLREHLLQLKNGQSSCCLIVGEAGIGKTRLIDDLCEQVEAEGISLLMGAGDAMESTTAYFAWRQVFRTLFGLQETDGAESWESRRGLQHLVMDLVEEDDYLIERLPLLNAVLPLGLPESALTSQMSGELRAQNTRDTLVRFLQRTRQNANGMVLIVEDAHWLDSASWALLATVQQYIQPLFLVIGLRPMAEPLPKEYVALKAADDTAYLELQPLGHDATLDLVCQGLKVRALDPELAALIQEKAEGHPFFSEELAYALRDAGLLEIDNFGTAHLSAQAGDRTALSFPDTVQGVIISRIDRLPPAQQVTLKVASVIGRIFAFRTLRDIHPVEADRPRLEEYLGDLEQLDITRLQSEQPDLKYIFKHHITHEVAYNLMLYTQRRDLHQRVALWYEQVFNEDLSAFYPLLAYHWSRAENSEKALEYLEKAGAQALRNYANEEAITFFGQALALAEKAGHVEAVRRGLWELQLGEAYVNHSLYAEGRTHLVQGLALAGYPLPEGKISPLFKTTGALGVQIAHRLWPGRYLGRDQEKRGLLLSVARAYEKLAEVLYSSNDLVLVLYTSFNMLNLAELVGPSPELGRGYGMVGVMMGFSSLHQLAQAYLRWALAAVDAADDLSARAWVAFLGSVYYGGIGNWGEAERLQQLSIEISLRSGAHHIWNLTVYAMIELYYCQGKFTQGFSLAEEMYQHACDHKDLSYQIFALYLKVTGLFYLGRMSEAKACVKEAESLVALNPELMTQNMKLLVLREELGIYLYQEAYDYVFAQAQELMALIKSMSLTDYGNLLIYTILVEAYLILWEKGYAQADLKSLAYQACQQLDKFVNSCGVARPRALLMRGRADWLSGNHGRALKLWKQGLRVAQNLKMDYDEAWLSFAIGLHLEPGISERETYLKRAREIFAKLGVEHELWRLRE